jgi:hypothetical protein
MTEVNPNAPEANGAPTSGPDTNSAAHAQTNGTAANADATASSSTAGQSDAMKRASALADRLALQFGVVSTVVTEGLKRIASRVREEAEDLWAEAQHIRKGKKP